MFVLCTHCDLISCTTNDDQYHRNESDKLTNNPHSQNVFRWEIWKPSSIIKIWEMMTKRGGIRQNRRTKSKISCRSNISSKIPQFYKPLPSVFIAIGNLYYLTTNCKLNFKLHPFPIHSTTPSQIPNNWYFMNEEELACSQSISILEV